MALRLYRRHRKECEARHPEDFRSGEFEEAKRGFKRCHCLIVASGTLHGTFNRRTTGQHSWDDARAVAASWKTWNDTPDAPPPVVQVEHRTTIDEALTAFVVSCQNRGVSAPTLSKYRTFAKQLRAYCEARGYGNAASLDILTRSDADRFYASWKDGRNAKAKKLERFKSFVKFALKRKWLAENIADDLKPPVGSSVLPQKSPFDDDELKRIYEACEEFDAAPRGIGFRNWTGEDVRDFVNFAIHTGLRISDIATFDIAKKLKGNNVALRMHKTGRQLYTYIPDWLVERLRAREKRLGPLVFRSDLGTSTTIRAMAEVWRKRLGYVFAKAGAFEDRPTPHRFRHTFVRILLQRGVPVADAAELIGDTEQVLRRHYAKWIPERQERLTRILKDAFEEKPKLTAVRPGRC